MRRAVRRGPTGLAQRRHARRHDRTYRSPADKTSRAFGPPTPPRNHAGDAQAHPACDGGTRTPRPRPPPHRHRNTGSTERLICEKCADQVTARPPDSPGRTSDCPAAPRESTHIREASAQGTGRSEGSPEQGGGAPNGGDRQAECQSTDYRRAPDALRCRRLPRKRREDTLRRRPTMRAETPVVTEYRAL